MLREGQKSADAQGKRTHRRAGQARGRRVAARAWVVRALRNGAKVWGIMVMGKVCGPGCCVGGERAPDAQGMQTHRRAASAGSRRSCVGPRGA